MTSSVTVHQLDVGLLTGAVVLLAAVAAVRLSARSGVPSLLLYLGLGLLLGEGALGVRFDDAALTQVLGYAALVLILAEGGLTTSWKSIRPAVGVAAALSTVGVLVSVAVVGVVAYAILDVPWPVALLIGAILSSTDAAAVFSVLRRVPIHPRLAGVLEAESGLNDAPVVLLVIALAETAGGKETHSWGALAAIAAGELALGAVLGLGIGVGGASALRRLAVPSSGLQSLAVLATCVAAYGATATLHGSGFLAVYVCALVLGNSPGLRYRSAIRGFAESLGTLAQIGLFVLLGLLASPSRLPEQVLPALALGAVLLLLARPLSVLVSATPFRLPWRHQAFLSWAGLRGAVPVVLATVPQTTGMDDAAWMFDLVFVLVVVFTLVQAPLLPWVGRRLGVTDDLGQRELDVEVSSLEELGADMVQIRIGPTSQLAGVSIFELRLPVGANVTMLVRDGGGLVPGPQTVLRRGDTLLVVATSATRRTAVSRIRDVSRGGRLAGWLGPAARPADRRRTATGDAVLGGPVARRGRSRRQPRRRG